MTSFKRRTPKRAQFRSEVFSAEVRDLASDGRGVLQHPSGKTFFAPGVWPGEAGEFRSTGGKGRVGFAELVALSPGREHPQRQNAPCAHHGFGAAQCGGCPWQFMAYDAQLAAKQTRVTAELARLGEADKVLPIWPSPQIFGYRNRAQFKTDGREIGYVSAASNTLAPVQHCPVLSEPNQHTLQTLRAQLPNRAWQPARRSAWRTLDIDESIAAEQVCVDQRLPFKQGNSAQNTRMRAWLAERIAPGTQQAVELFCGSGNLTEVLCDAGVAKISAVEVVDEAIAALRAKVLAGVEPIVCDLFADDGLASVARALKTAELLVLDPPREGWKSRAAAWPKNCQVRQVLSVSCDLATFTRDLSFFLDQGFRLVEVQPLDQFPHTPHIELLAHLEKDR